LVCCAFLVMLAPSCGGTERHVWRHPIRQQHQCTLADASRPCIGCVHGQQSMVSQ
jgi:hypothetical protein